MKFYCTHIILLDTLIDIMTFVGKASSNNKIYIKAIFLCNNFLNRCADVTRFFFSTKYAEIV